MIQILNRSHLWLMVFVLIVLAFSALVLQQALLFGKLSIPPVYDDVSYYSMAIERLMLLRDEGIGALLSNIYSKGIHSYHSELLSFFSYIVIGPYVISPSILVVIFLLLFSGILLWATFGEINFTSLLALLLLFSLPLAANILLEIRPDFIAFSFMSLGLYLYTRKDSSFLSGALIAYAMVAKFTIAPLVLVLSLTAFFLRVATGGKAWRVNFSQAFTSSRKTLGIVLLIALPFYLLNYEHFNQYFYRVVFGEQQAIWAANQGMKPRILFMVSGGATQFSIGKAYLFMYPVILAQIGYLWLKDQPRFYPFMSYSVLLLCAYTILTMASVRTVYLDAAVPIMVLILFFDAIGYWVRKQSFRRSLWLALILAIIFNINNYSLRKYTTFLPSEIVFINHAVADLAVIGARTNAPQKIYMPISLPINRDVLAVKYSLQALRENLPTFKFRGNGYVADMDWQITQIQKFNYIYYPNKVYFDKRLPSTRKIPGQTDVSIQRTSQELNNKNKYSVAKRYDLTDGAEMILYKNLQIK